MPYASMEAAKKAGVKTRLDDCPLSLIQINKMAEMADAMKAEGKVDNPWAVAISNFKKTHKIENGKWIQNKESFNFKQNIHEMLSLSEGTILPDENGQKSYKAWWPLLKVGPGNGASKNYYSQKAIESAAPLALSRRKMFLGHIPGEVTPTERNVKDWAASIGETKVDNGVLWGLVRAYDPWLKDRMYDAPGELGCSIEGRGKPSGTIDHNGEKWNLIEEVKWINAFNIVDYPGNAPMGIQLTESDTDTDEGEKYMDIAELKEKNIDLYNGIVKEVKEAAKAEFDKITEAKDAEIKKLKETQTADAVTITSLKESATKVENRLDALEALGKKKDRDAKISTEMAKLPAEAITDKFKELVESAKDEKAAMELIEERAKLFENKGKILGHGKTKSGEEGLKEREAIMLHALGQKTPEEVEAERKAAEKK